METVKAVPKFEVFCSTIGGSSSSSQRSSVSARQIRPRPSFAMKLIVPGVTFSAARTRSPSFSRSSSSTMTTNFPARRSSAASSIEEKEKASRSLTTPFSHAREGPPDQRPGAGGAGVSSLWIA
jgi:hypothetical protein